jgi:hypothetical protein
MNLLGKIRNRTISIPEAEGRIKRYKNKNLFKKSLQDYKEEILWGEEYLKLIKTNE